MTGEPAHRTTALGRLPGLEALRGVAAICVLLLHVRAVFGGQPVFGKGYLGVDFFLMLSGFLMARTQETRCATGLDPLAFLWKRYKRLWPTMAAGGLLGLPRLFTRTDGPFQFAAIAAANLALVPVSFRREVFPLNIPAWTIFYELVANALHVLLFWRLRNAWLWLSIALLGAVVAWIGMAWGSLDVGARPEHFLAGLPRILFAYLIGIALCRWWGSTPPLPIPAIVSIVAMPAVLASGWWLEMDKTWLFDFAFVLVVCPAMIAGALRLASFHRTAGVLGQLSFPLFALQMPVLQGAQMLGFGYWAGLGAALVAGIVGMVLPKAFAQWRSARPVEKPA